jgi:hypothetical protein
VKPLPRSAQSGATAGRAVWSNGDSLLAPVGSASDTCLTPFSVGAEFDAPNRNCCPGSAGKHKTVDLNRIMEYLYSIHDDSIHDD